MARTILVVEDTDLYLDTLEIALAQIPGVDIHMVRTGEEALRCLTDEICALITDLHLPEMDGFELIEAIRAQPDRLKLPILVISGDSDPATPSRLAALGVDAHFAKPFSPAEVRNRLEHLIHVS
jgi:DNA-binding response OmpR family regulator